MTMKNVDPAHLRSIVLAGHAGGGKTTLAEHLLFQAGAIQRLGKVDDGTAHLDYEPEEQKRRESLSLAVATFEHDSTRITLVDTPGYPDFVSEVVEGFAAADGALFVMDASAGVGAGLENAVAIGRSTGRAACFFINKSDRENANPTAALDALRSAFGNKIAPLHLAIGAGESFEGYVDLVHRKAWKFDGKTEVEIPIPEELTDEIARRRDQLLEAAAEADDDVLTKYLEGEEVSDEELDACLHRGVRDSILAPVLVGSAAKGIGMAALLDAFIRYMPTAAEEPPVPAKNAQNRRRGHDHPRSERPARRPRVQDRRGPVRRPADLPPRPLRHAPRPGPRLEREPRGGRADGPAAPPPRQGPGADRRAARRRDRRGREARHDGDGRHALDEGAADHPAAARLPAADAVGRDRAPDEGRPRQDGRGPSADARGGAVGAGRAVADRRAAARLRPARPTSRSSASG